jgi:serine/threonine protein kinase
VEAIGNAILEKDVQFDKAHFKGVSNQAKDFICLCLRKKFEERPTVKELFEEPWIKKWVEDPVIKESTTL